MAQHKNDSLRDASFSLYAFYFLPDGFLFLCDLCCRRLTHAHPCAGRKFKVFVYGDTNSKGGQRQTDSTQLKVEAPDIGRPSSTPCWKQKLSM